MSLTQAPGETHFPKQGQFMLNRIKSFLLLTSCLVSISALSKGKIVLVDVRTPQEFAQEHLPSALNIDIKNQDFSKQISALDKEDSYLIYCHSGRRSELATQQMIQLGFKQVKNIGGINQAKKYLEMPH